MLVEVRPALAMEAMFAEVVALASRGPDDRRGLPRNLFDLAALARRYDRRGARAVPVRCVQRLLLAPLLIGAQSSSWNPSLSVT